MYEEAIKLSLVRAALPPSPSSSFNPCGSDDTFILLWLLITCRAICGWVKSKLLLLCSPTYIKADG